MRRELIWLASVAAIGAGAVLAAWNGSRAAPANRFADMPAGKMATTNVDAELVLAVDVSYSMDPEEQALQREGYVHGLTSPEFLNGLRSGMHGRVAITYFEWAGVSDQRVVVPWRLIDGPAAAKSFADAIMAASYRRAYRTSISGALTFAAPLFDESGYRGIRRVIDVSGDGANNQGPPVAIQRDELIGKGFTINGLPIMLKRPNIGSMDIDNLDVYYEDCVIGGPAAFVIPIRERDQFKEATRTKLVLEVAGLTPKQTSKPRVIPASAEAPRISCTIGERMWQQRWGGRDYN